MSADAAHVSTVMPAFAGITVSDHASLSGRLYRRFSMSPRFAVFVLALSLTAAFAAQALGRPSALAARTFHFKSPSGNINCGGSATGVTCLLLHNNWKKLRPRPASCDLDWTPTDMSLFLNTRTRRWGVAVGGCRGDIGPLCYRQDPCAVLKYGASTTASVNGRGIRCTSRATGVTCARFGRGVGARGFRVARQGYALLR